VTHTEFLRSAKLDTLFQSGAQKIFDAIFRDFREVRVGDFGVVYCYRGVTPVDYECLQRH
jgi:hypothetical protein